MKKVLKKIFNESAEIFFAEESANIMNGVAERNLCGRLSIYLTDVLQRRGVTGYYADTEYNRKQDGRIKTILNDKMEIVNVQCDLIVHSRGTIIEQDNLIAIEMKKLRRPEAEKINDRIRLKALTKDSFDDVWSYDGVAHPEHVCGYIMGLYMIIDNVERTCIVEYYRKGDKVGQNTLTF